MGHQSPDWKEAYHKLRGATEVLCDWLRDYMTDPDMSPSQLADELEEQIWVIEREEGVTS